MDGHGADGPVLQKANEPAIPQFLNDFEHGQQGSDAGAGNRDIAETDAVIGEVARDNRNAHGLIVRRIIQTLPQRNPGKVQAGMRGQVHRIVRCPMTREVLRRGTEGQRGNRRYAA